MLSVQRKQGGLWPFAVEMPGLPIFHIPCHSECSEDSFLRRGRTLSVPLSP